MRYTSPVFAALIVFVFSNFGFAQTADPFGNSSPFGDDPFGRSKRSQTADKDQSGPKATSPRDNPFQDKVKRAIASGKKPQPIGIAKRYQAEARIEAVLNDETTFSFIQTPLSEAVQILSELHNIPIVIDRRALEEIGLSTDLPVVIELKNVTLRSALRLLLREYDLTYIVKDEVLQITTMEAAEQSLVIEMYTLPPNLAAKSDGVIKVLTATVVPSTWDVMGGPSSAVALDHVLVVSTTSDIQSQTREFLARLVDKYGQ